MRWLLLALMMVGCAPSPRAQRILLIGVPPAYRQQAVATIDSWSHDPSISWSVQPYPIEFSHPTLTGDFGIVTACTSWTDLNSRTIHLSFQIHDGLLDLEDPAWELRQLR